MLLAKYYFKLVLCYYRMWQLATDSTLRIDLHVGTEVINRTAMFVNGP